MNSFQKIRYVLSHRIRVFRNQKNLSQERLAEKADIHPTYVSCIESGKKLPTLYVICKIADAFGIEVYELFLGDEKVKSREYKKRKLINILNESKPTYIDLYSTVLKALHDKYKRKRKKM